MKSTTPSPLARRLFLDANVIISGVAFGGVPGQLLEAAARGMFCGVVSEYVLEEVARALTLKFGETEAAAEGLLGSLHLAIVPPAATARRMQASRRISDPADVAVLAAALSAKADALVTGDAHFFTPAIQALVPVLTPREALDLLRRPSSGDTRP